VSAAPERAPGLYVHVPFCRRICPYCDFAVTLGDAAARSRFVALLECEARLRASPELGAPFDTVYLGGGTPSALSPEDLARLLEALREALPIDPGALVYLEANPEDVTADSLAAWREQGVSTLSLGVQALDDASLRLLGRGHDAGTALRAVEAALGAGFATVSLDLIYARPGQTAAAWAAELERAAGLGAHHLSCYELTFHEGTHFEKRRRQGRLVPLPDDEQAVLLRLTHERLGKRGYAGYEVSNFARAPHHRSAHNRKYWSHVPYLGLGPSAHSFDGERRRWNLRSLRAWSERLEAGADPAEGEETIGPRERALETLMLGLRTTEGVDLVRLGELLGGDVRQRNAARLEQLVEAGLVRLDGPSLKPTTAGLAVADGLAAALELPGD
jgi:oxygen-independent coproporphyrinogen-3 oxidase